MRKAAESDSRCEMVAGRKKHQAAVRHDAVDIHVV